MKVFHSIGEAGEALRGGSIALGNFDGVHKGHQALFARAMQHRPAAAFTFLPHPGKVLQPELAPKLITLLPRKLELLEGLGLDAVVVQPFTLEYAKTSPDRFEAELFDRLGVAHVVVGHDFTYGQKRAGTVTQLREAAARRNATVHLIDPVTVDGVVASSSKVREYILEGRVTAAERLLGRHFDLDGVVVTGQGRGRGIGFPTANVDTQNELRPAPGVYAVRVKVRDRDDRPWSSEWRGGAANIGIKPTFGGHQITIEVHLFDFSGDLYGKRLRVEFLERLRAEQRFASVAELTTQIQRDVETARTVFARAGS